MMFERVRRRLVREDRLYIMPTARGALFLGVVVVMILTAATYNNNLVFILAFFLFALFVVSMLQTHDNLRGVRVEFSGATGTFAGEVTALNFHLSHRRRRGASDLRVRVRNKALRVVDSPRADLIPGEVGTAALARVSAPRRGVFGLGDVILQTEYPHGMFRAWTVARPAGEIIVYPPPRGSELLAPGIYRAGEAETAGQSHSPDGDFGELTAYRAGESYHRIAWKHFARTGALYQKVHWGAARPHFVIPWRAASEIELEQVSRWIDLARAGGASFELTTPDVMLGPGMGDDLAHACWRELARARGPAR